MVTAISDANAKHRLKIRPAVASDCRAIAELFLIASDGLAEYIWSRSATIGTPLVEIGAQRYAREGVAFSYRNCIIAESNGAVVGILHSFPMERPTQDAESDAPDPVLRPYSELEDYESLYISAVAVFPGHRGKGIGTRLLAVARARAQREALARLSLICFENNRDAMRLYRRLGFREVDRRALVPHPSLRYSDGDAVLLACAVDQATE